MHAVQHLDIRDERQLAALVALPVTQYASDSLREPA